MRLMKHRGHCLRLILTRQSGRRRTNNWLGQILPDKKDRFLVHLSVSCLHLPKPKQPMQKYTKLYESFLCINVQTMPICTLTHTKPCQTFEKKNMRNFTMKSQYYSHYLVMLRCPRGQSNNQAIPNHAEPN